MSVLQWFASLDCFMYEKSRKTFFFHLKYTIIEFKISWRWDINFLTWLVAVLKKVVYVIHNKWTKLYVRAE